MSWLKIMVEAMRFPAPPHAKTSNLRETSQRVRCYSLRNKCKGETYVGGYGERLWHPYQATCSQRYAATDLQRGREVVSEKPHNLWEKWKADVSGGPFACDRHLSPSPDHMTIQNIDPIPKWKNYAPAFGAL